MSNLSKVLEVTLVQLINFQVCWLVGLGVQRSRSLLSTW